MECIASTCQKLATQETTDGPLCHHHYMSWRLWGHVGSKFAPVCTVEGCLARHTSGGLCSRHYKLMKETGSTADRPSRRRKRQRCTIDDCDLLVMGNGLCSKHYTRMRRYGMTDLPPAPVPDPLLCAQCGGERPSRRRVYCSDVCSQRAMFHYRKATSRPAQLRRYGLTVETYADLLAAQGGACAICKDTNPKNFRGRNESFAVDHCHDSGRVRGLLCNPCNSGLGQFRDDPALLEAAMQYLTASATIDVVP